MIYKNILLIGGTHGDERTGINLVNYFQKNSQKYINPLLANKLAVKKNIRFIETDLNRSVSKSLPISHEEKLAKGLTNQIKKAKLAIEFHNTTAHDNTCAIVTTEPSKLHIALAAHFGLKRILIMPAQGTLSGLNSKKFFSLEISNSDKAFTNINLLKNKLLSLNSINYEKTASLKIYKYIGATVTKKTLKRLKISLAEIKNFQAFDKKITSSLHLPTKEKYCPIFFGEKNYGNDFAFQIVKLV